MKLRFREVIEKGEMEGGHSAFGQNSQSLSKFEKTASSPFKSRVTFSTVWLKELFRVWMRPVKYSSVCVLQPCVTDYLFYTLLNHVRLEVVAHAWDSSIWEAEAGECESKACLGT